MSFPILPRTAQSWSMKTTILGVRIRLKYEAYTAVPSIMSDTNAFMETTTTRTRRGLTKATAARIMIRMGTSRTAACQMS